MPDIFKSKHICAYSYMIFQMYYTLGFAFHKVTAWSFEKNLACFFEGGWRGEE